MIHKSKAVLNPTVIGLGLVALFADISSEMLYPITPLFLTAVLGASFTSVGLIEGTAEAVASILKIFSGSISDRFGHRKIMIAFGYFLSAAGKPIIGASGTWTEVFFARSLDRLGKGVRVAPRDSLLSDAVSDEDQGAAFGWHRGMDSLGAVIGPLIALLFISNRLDRLRSAYFWALVPGLIAVLIVFAIRDDRATPAANSVNLKAPLSSGFKLYLLIWGLFSLVNSSDVFLLLKAGQESLSPTRVILLYCLYNVVYAVASPYLGALSDRIGRYRILAMGFFIFSLVYLGYAFASHVWQFGVLFAAYGIYIAATDGVGKAFAVDLLPKSSRATGIGWLGFVTGFSTIVASTAAGYLWDSFGPVYPFLYGAAGSFLAMLLLLLLRQRLVLKIA